MKKLLLILGLLCITSAAYADKEKHICTGLVEGLDDSDLVSARSFTTTRSNDNRSAFNLLNVYIDHDDSANGTVTRVDMTCVGITDNLDSPGSTEEFIIQVCSVSSGVCTSSDNDFQKTVSGTEDKKWIWRVDVSGLQNIKCTFDAGAGSGHADDRLDVDYQFCVN